MALQQYIDDTRDLVRDSNGLFWTDAQITRYVNQARTQIALLSGCIQLLVPGIASVGGGATPGTMIPGAMTPGMPDDSGFNTITGVEKYAFDYANAYVRSQNSNIQGVIDVVTVAVSQGVGTGVARPALDWLPWENFQAYCRSVNWSSTSFPAIWSTFGDGLRGQVWLWPVPNQALEMEWQVFCNPAPMYNDSTPEALPDPWAGFVQFYAAHLAFLNAQRYGQAEDMVKLFEINSGLSRSASDRGKTDSFYR